MLPLIRTLFDITLLRRGPEDIPHSWFIFYLCIALWLFGLVSMTLFLQSTDARDAWVSVATWVLGLVCYVFVLVIFGQTNRGVQTVSALAGTGAIILGGILAILVIVTPTLGADKANLGAVLVMFWSVPVEGHIIARAIERHWYIGIVIAMLVFVLQWSFEMSLSLEP